MNQLALFDSDTRRLEHGGRIRRGQRKLARPIDPKRPLHLVLRSSRARGAWSFLSPKNRVLVEKLLQVGTKHFGVKLLNQANVGNHLHLVVVPKNKALFQHFLRWFSGRLAFTITGAKKGNPVGRFWDALAYSKVLSWGRELEFVKNYLFLNRLEAVGFDRRTPIFSARLISQGLQKAPES